jgi:protein-disulfide isomerase
MHTMLRSSGTRSKVSITVHALSAIALTLFSSVFLLAQAPGKCAPLDADTRSRALRAAARSMGAEQAFPEIDHEALLPDTCYWQLFVNLPHDRHAVLFVSPDHRFVSPALWDMSADPDKEDAKVDAQLRSGALADQVPFSGPERAPVTLVLFSDLECPYCANFSRMLEQYERENPGKLRVIYRNSPLPMHPWAKEAARSGICVAQQSSEAFWRFQSFLFARQKETSADNLGVMIDRFLQTMPDAQRAKYTECMATPYPDARLQQDLAEVNAFHIHSTPTMFINGRRYRGFPNEEAFAAAVNANTHAEVAKQGGQTK